jgi:hypothetical protein
MLKPTVAFVLLVLVVLAGAAPIPILTFDSYGFIAFGSRVSDVETKLGEQAEVAQVNPKCGYVTFKRYPNVAFMVEDGVITRADVSEEVPNTLGITVGTSFSDVKRKFPNVIVERHEYDPDGHYLILKSADKKKAIVMEESDGKVTRVRGGLIPSVQYVEGCV